MSDLMVLRRGFKSEASWYAREMRGELHLHPHEKLCPWLLSDHLGYDLRPLSIFGSNIPEDVEFLVSREGQRIFSAITLFGFKKPLIIFNDGHSRKRQAADIAHELAHGILLHPPKPLINNNGSRDYDIELEEEANWLGPTLLVSDEAALYILEMQMSDVVASDYYGASIEVIRMRKHVSGAVKRFDRRRIKAA